MRRETFTQSSPYMVFDTPPVAQVAEAQARAGVGAPWWTDRNDSRLNPRDAIAPGPVSLYEVRIYDYQQSYDDHVHDHYNRTVRSVEFGQGSR
ncbi:MAG: hypothetical protein GC162_16400 [Planctomycetes bacterium]|nr:hypothetical protein [Planctomycetota bacterium]